MAKYVDISDNIRIFQSEEVLILDAFGRVSKTSDPQDGFHPVPLVLFNRSELSHEPYEKKYGLKSVRGAIDYARENRLDSCSSFLAAQLAETAKSTKPDRYLLRHLRTTSDDGKQLEEAVRQCNLEAIPKLTYGFLLSRLEAYESAPDAVLERLLDSFDPFEGNPWESKHLKAEVELRSYLLMMPAELTLLNEVGMDFFIQNRERSRDPSPFLLGERHDQEKDTQYVTNGSCKSDQHIILLHEDALDMRLTRHEVTHFLARLGKADQNKEFIDAVKQDLWDEMGRGEFNPAWQLLRQYGRDFEERGYKTESFPAEMMVELHEFREHTLLQFHATLPGHERIAEEALNNHFPQSYPHYQNFRHWLETTAHFVRQDGMEPPKMPEKRPILPEKLRKNLEPETVVEGIVEMQGQLQEPHHKR